jgi:hypothetical protein
MDPSPNIINMDFTLINQDVITVSFSPLTPTEAILGLPTFTISIAKKKRIEKRSRQAPQILLSPPALFGKNPCFAMTRGHPVCNRP